MTATTLKYATDALIAARDVLEAAKVRYELACDEVARHCPHQPGDTCELGYLGGTPQAIFVRRVHVDVYQGVVRWHVNGMKVTAAGQPHKTATAIGTMDVAQALEAQAIEAKLEARRAAKEQEWVAAEQKLSSAESLDLDIERGAERRLWDASQAAKVSRLALEEIRKLIAIGEENANDTLLLEKAISTSEWANCMRGSIETMLAHNTYLPATVRFFEQQGIKA